MNMRFEAAWEIHQFLTKHGIEYAIIGGMHCLAGESRDLQKM